MFIFKEDEYTLRELFDFHNSNKNIFKTGEVIDTITGEIFDISEIHSLKERYYGRIKRRDRKCRKLY